MNLPMVEFRLKLKGTATVTKEIAVSCRCDLCRERAFHTLHLPESVIAGGVRASRLFLESGLVSSGKEFRHLVENRGAVINEEKITDIGYVLSRDKYKSFKTDLWAGKLHAVVRWGDLVGGPGTPGYGEKVAAEKQRKTPLDFFPNAPYGLSGENVDAG
jgi:hypothetical protein